MPCGSGPTVTARLLPQAALTTQHSDIEASAKSSRFTLSERRYDGSQYLPSELWIQAHLVGLRCNPGEHRPFSLDVDRSEASGRLALDDAVDDVGPLLEQEDEASVEYVQLLTQIAEQRLEVRTTHADMVARHR
jgi:hypothetical protein